MFGFEMQDFTLEEDSGDTSVVFGKVNNDMTEVSLDVIIDFDIQSAGLMEGHCSSTVTNHVSNVHIRYCVNCMVTFHV